MKSKPLISIGMPVFNGGKHLKEAITTTLKQTYSNFELIISDDNSTDNSSKIISNYSKKESRIKFFKQKQNIGSIANFNFVLSKARGEFFTWFAQDDIHDKDFLFKLQANIKKTKSVLAMSDYRNFKDNKFYKIYNTPKFLNEDSNKSLSYFFNTVNLSFFYGLYKTRVLKKIGGYHTDFRWYFQSSDFLTIIKTLLKGKFVFIDEVLFFKRDTGLYTNQFENIKNLPFSTVSKYALRYFLFPIHFIFDMILGSWYLLSSSKLKFINRLVLVFLLFKCTLKRFYDFLLNIFKGAFAFSIRILKYLKIKK
jgi:glycosyltransferase involved in cell wall biosynthesis